MPDESNNSSLIYPTERETNIAENTGANNEIAIISLLIIGSLYSFKIPLKSKIEKPTTRIANILSIIISKPRLDSEASYM